MPQQYSAPPSMIIDESKTYTATLKTNHGDITLELFGSEAPFSFFPFPEGRLGPGRSWAPTTPGYRCSLS